jgi:hypothetical protein
MKTSRNKVKQRTLYELKLTTKYKRRVEQTYGKISEKKNHTEILEIKSLSSNKKHSGRPLQQTKTSGRQKLRARR